MSDENDDTLELGEPDKLPKKMIFYGGARQGGKAQAAVNQAYEKGRADMRREIMEQLEANYKTALAQQSTGIDWDVGMEIIKQKIKDILDGKAELPKMEE